MAKDKEPVAGRQATRQYTNMIADVILLPQRLNPAVSRYFEPLPPPPGAGALLQAPEVPTSEELTSPPAYDEETGKLAQVPTNLREGPWPDKKTYLEANYQFLREEAVRPLREAVLQLKITPMANEDAFNGAVGIYEKVHIIGLKTSTRGIAIKVTFSTQRCGKKIQWEQAHRLLSGSLVALTPSADMFKKKTVVATIAARPLEGLNQNPPELELFFARASELEIDPSVPWTMCEARSSFFEAERHTMLALQKMMHEPFPLADQLVNGDNIINPPAYLPKSPSLDLKAISASVAKTNILAAWPEAIESDLDASQLSALRLMLTKSLAIVQGPPGTGKTFVSVKALEVLLANRSKGDPPIVVTAQTNHALDQLLRHVAQFAPDFVRIGGRSKDRGVIAERTLYAVRHSTKQEALPGCQAPGARKDMHRIEKAIETLLLPLKASDHALDHHALQKLNLLSEKQTTSLEDGANQWVQAGLRNPAEARAPFAIWLAHTLIKVPYKPQFEDFGFEYEEADVEYEQLKDIEAENAAKEEEFVDALYGSFFELADNYTCTKSNAINDQAVERFLKKEQDLWRIPEAARPSVYNYLQRRMKEALRDAIRAKAHEYDKAARRARIGNWEKDELILKEQKVIGLTTTGLSKYRGLIASLGCKIILVEEAAETLEAPVIIACIPSLEHLILVGDHKQLRPHCKVKEHERKPYYWNISMFERLVNNKIPLETLTQQRRMIPEIRRILRPIYGEAIKDHPSVSDPLHRPDVPGMGGINSWFFTHHWPERRDNMMSCINTEEAEMIIGFVEHLVYNGTQSEDITILTFYNGQRKQIIRGLQRSSALLGLPFSVVTVDSYQGEENKVVILSLVRSNDSDSIGFLSIKNRICVALSRAQCGFYIFGNGMLVGRTKTWNKVIKIMFGKDGEVPTLEPQRFDQVLPVHCTKHQRRLNVTAPSDWSQLTGGCEKPCEELLSCGHRCPQLCHPFTHDLVACTEPCKKVLECGHRCTLQCSEVCHCKLCNKPTQQLAEPLASKEVSLPHSSGSDSSSKVMAWQDFAMQESARWLQAVALPSRNTAHEGSGGRSTRAIQAPVAAPEPVGSPLKREMLLIEYEEEAPPELDGQRPVAPTNQLSLLQSGMGSVSLLD